MTMLFKLNKFSIQKTIIIAFLFFILVACGETEPIIPDPNINEDEEEQVETPFNNVPETSDIIMYEVNMRAFSKEGSLDGVTERLDSISGLGVNVIWLMPIYPIGELNGVGSPYAVSDYREVNPEFGTLADLRELVAKAHELDMAVILDWVGNHTAWDHVWIENDSWYLHDDNGDLISPNGWTDVVDLNFDSQEMREAMIEAMVYWVNEAKIDGYRCDFADGVPSDFWKKAIDELNTIPDHELIFFAEGTRTENYSAGFDLNFGWNFYNALKAVYNENKSVSTIFKANSDDYKSIPSESHMLHFITNHDDNAWDDIPQKIFRSQEGSMAAFVISAFMGGVPMLYNGQEVGFQSKISFFTNTPINWTLNPEITAEYKKIISIRKESVAVKTGSLVTYSNSNDVVAFKRISGDEEVFVLVNVRNESVSYQLPDDVANTIWTNQMNNVELSLSNSIQIDPFTYVILKN